MCLISMHLFMPRVFEGLLVTAQGSPPALTPLLVKQVDEMVEHVWLKCGLDKGSLEDVRKHFNYNHVLDILSRSLEKKLMKLKMLAKHCLQKLRKLC